MKAAARILIVDDSALFRTSIRRVVEEAGFAVAGTARNGHQALIAIDSLLPDAVILDLEMPGMNGIELLQAIKQRQCRHRPQALLVFSAVSQQAASSTMEALRLGADDFVPKPRSGTGGIADSLIPKLQGLLGSDAGTTTSLPPQRAVDHNRVRRVVAIASSTGGPGALTTALSNLPEHLPVPIVITQHMPPLFTASLARTLNGMCALQVKEAEDGEPLAPGSVLIAPGDYHLTVVDNKEPRVRLTQDAPLVGLRPAADIMFRSLADLFGGAFLAAVFTGMGKDGRDGLQDHAHLPFACLTQTAESCVVYGMPQAVDQAGLAEAHFTPADFATTITRYQLRWNGR